MTDRIVLLRNLVRIPYYHAGLGTTLVTPQLGEGTFSIRELRLTIGTVQERILNGRIIRAVEIKGHPQMIGAWIDVDTIPQLRQQLDLPERDETSPKLIL